MKKELKCPKCGGVDEMDCASNRHAGVSEIYCNDCGFIMQGKCPENILLKRFYKKYKQKLVYWRNKEQIQRRMIKIKNAKICENICAF